MCDIRLGIRDITMRINLCFRRIKYGDSVEGRETTKQWDKMPRGSDRDVEHVFMCLLAVCKFCADSVG